MSEQVMTWGLLSVELLAMGGLWVVGKRRWWGWLLVLVSSLAWAGYGLAQGTYAFVVMSGLWAAMHIRNMLLWRRLDAQESAAATF